MTPTARFSIAAGVVVAAIAGLVVWSLQSSTAYYMTPTELTSGAKPAKQNVRVAGRVVDGSIVRQGAVTRFDLSDGVTALTITTKDVLPDTFAADIETVAEGGMVEPGLFSAATVLVKCPSKFESELAAGTP
jgi:cytochrome c-type biogenesis protein CcmE